jgi:hypothetical protein
VAGGPGSRWGGYLGVPKHLAPVCGETVLGRLVRQFAAVGDVTIVGPSEYRMEGAGLFVPEVRETDADKFMSSQELWDGRTLVVFGDVFLTDVAFNLIAGLDDVLTAFGRFGPSKFTGTPYGELFAFNLPAADHERVKGALWELDRWHRAGRINRSAGWELYRRLNGATLANVRKHRRMSGPCRFVEIDDWSDDFDYPEDWDSWTERRKRAGLPV